MTLHDFALSSRFEKPAMRALIFLGDGYAVLKHGAISHALYGVEMVED